MTVSLKHGHTAVGTDAGNGEVNKARWNAEHALTGGANTLLGFGGSGLPTEYPRNIITVPGTDSNVTVTDTGTGATATVTLDNSTVATFSGSTLTLATDLLVQQVFKIAKAYEEGFYAPAANTAFTVDLANGTMQVLPTNGNTTITLPSPTAGRSYLLLVYYNGAHTITWAGGGTLKWAGNITPSTSSATAKWDLFSFICGNSNTFGQVVGKGY